MDTLLTYYGHGGQITGYHTEMRRSTDTDIIVFATLTLAPDGTPVASALLPTRPETCFPTRSGRWCGTR